MGKIGGDCKIEINDKPAVLGTSCSYMPSGETREIIDSMFNDGQVRFSGRQTPGMIEFEALLDPDQDIDALTSLRDATVLLTTGNGDKVSGSGMTRIGEEPARDAVAGTVTITLRGRVKLI